MSEFVVAKYGGTSMAAPERVAEIVEARPEQRIIVVSAPGKSPEHDVKATQLLKEYACVVEEFDGRREREIQEELIGRYDSAYHMLGETALARLRDTFVNRLRPSPEDKDREYFASVGEEMSALYFGDLLGVKVVYPRHITFRTNQYNAPALHRKQTKRAIENDSLLGNHRVVIPGYFGFDEAMDYPRRHLLGDGGSDRTGAIYASALGWNYENWTDRDGVFEADPRLIPSARVIPALTREEVREGAHGGNPVLQGDTIVDLNGSDIAVTIKNTFNPDAPGTKITVTRQVEPNEGIVAVTGKGIAEVTIQDLGMAETSGYLAKVLAHAEELGLSVEHVPAAQDAVTLTFSRETPSTVLEDFRNLVSSDVLSAHARISCNVDKAVVYAVGENLRQPQILTRVLGRLFSELASRDITADTVVSNPRSPSIALLVDGHDMEEVISYIHDDHLSKSDV